ncbi:MAG: hypothetical protein GIW99_05560 [Candidatus Eremiobacteraeota bacterium]|nr:hypothetical protein [Candidatus Eremiobacteraeota bacterium]MBC5827134.1 hypothetical protein [Candidatus Eremiobacteraeota bacterium]
MDQVVLERTIAVIGALIVGASALTSLAGEWKKTGLDDQVSKVMLGLLTVGCVIVILAATGVVGKV